MDFYTQLEYWKNSLIDLGKKNKLINYKDSKRSSISIIEPELNTLWNKIVVNEEKLKFPFSSDYIFADEKIVEMLEHDSDLKVECEVKELQKTLRNIKSKAKTYNEEQGINPLYLAFGFLDWYESENSNFMLHSPLVLVPVSVEEEDLTKPYTVNLRDDEIIVNPALTYKLQTDFGIDIKEDNFEGGLIDYLKSVQDKVEKLNWKVVNKVSMSLFSFYKISMYNDLEENKELIESSSVVQALIGNSSGLQNIPDSLNDIKHDNYKIEDTFQILDADSSQLDAIEYAKSGLSFVLQGPPGTGKSQTIANMISELIANGKKVLFVSSKMAALDVVYKRLKNAKLDSFCLSLHDPKVKKKDILKQLDDVFELSKQKINLTNESKEKLKELQVLREKLNNYNDELHKIRMPLNRTVFQINGELAKLEKYESIRFELDDIDVKNITQEKFSMILHSLEEYKNNLGETTLSWKDNCWGNAKINILTNELRHDIDYYSDCFLKKLIAFKNDFIDIQLKLPISVDYCFYDDKKFEKMLHEIEEDVGIPLNWCLNDSMESLLEEIKNEKSIQTELHSLKERISEIAYEGLKISNNIVDANKDIDYVERMINNDELFLGYRKYKITDVEEELTMLNDYVKRYNVEKNKLTQDFSDDILVLDYKDIFYRFKSEYNSVLRNFNKKYKEDKKIFLSMKKTVSKNISYKEMLDALYSLDEINRIKNDPKYNVLFYKAIWGTTFNGVDTDIAQINESFDKYKKSKEIEELLNTIIEKSNDQIEESKLLDHYGDLYCRFNTNWEIIQGKLLHFIKVKQKAKELGLDGEMLKHLYESNKDNANNKINEAVLIINNNVENCKTEFEWFQKLFESKEKFNGISLNGLIKLITDCKTNMQFLEKYIDFKNMRQNCYNNGLKSYIDRVEASDFSKDEIVPMFKKKFYRLWLDCIEKEVPDLINFRKEGFEDTIEKFRKLDKEQFEIQKYRIINKVLERLPNLDRLTNGNDEVSILKRELNKNRRTMSLRQLFKSIPNLIVALKPCLMMSPLSVSIFLDSSKFLFDTVIFDEASQIKTEDAIGAICRGKQAIIVGDNKQLPPTNFFTVTASDILDNVEDDEYNDIGAYDSILDEANLLPEKTLLWHYRSKHESLITFSNVKFYSNKLITFPSRTDVYENNGVEFIYVENGRYDRGGRNGNIEEAKKVAELVFNHFKQEPSRSLGVITFGEIQQYAIENEINKLRVNHPSFEHFFNEDNSEAFFVKSLENVQGDERDSIIFSIGYAKDYTDKMNMNFGPLSRVGGERRLNVAITRAKYNLKLVSSILPTEIDTDRISTEGPKLLKRYIEYAKDGVSVLESEIKNNEGNYFDSPFEEAVYNFLVEQGYDVRTQVGCSGYRIDMAIVDPYDKNRYSIGIECDGAMYHSTRTARERDRIRQMVLEDMGWVIYRIWSTDWIKNLDKEEDALIKAVEKSFSYHIEKNSEKENEKIEYANIEQNIEADENPYGLEYYKEFNYSFSNHSNKPLSTIIDLVINTEYPIHFDEICRRCATHLDRETASKKVKDAVQTELFFYRNRYDYDEGFYMPKGAKIKARMNIDSEYHISYRRQLKYIYKKELALIMKKIAERSLGTDKESLYKETAKVLKCSPNGNNTQYLDKAYLIMKEDNNIS